MEVLDALVSVIECYMIDSLLVAGCTDSIILQRHHARVVALSVWPIANDTLPRVDISVARQMIVEYYCGAVNVV